MLDMTQRLFGEVLLRPEPAFRRPEGPTQVASVGFFSLRDLVDPSVRWECVRVRLVIWPRSASSILPAALVPVPLGGTSRQ